MNRYFPLLLIFILIGGCAQAPAKLEQLQPSRWLEHQLAVSAIQSWNIRGRISVKTPHDSGTATLSWKQQFTDYEMRVIAPFGQGTYTLKGYANGVVMHGPNNETLTADSPEELMAQGFGWSVHLEGLKYWVRGIPEPGVKYSDLTLDENGRMSRLRQSGFDVSIQRYTMDATGALPEKIFIEGDNIELKMIIQSWET